MWFKADTDKVKQKVKKTNALEKVETKRQRQTQQNIEAMKGLFTADSSLSGLFAETDGR